MATAKESAATEVAMYNTNNAAAADSQRPAPYEPASHRDEEEHVATMSPASREDDILEIMLAHAGRLASEMRSISQSSSSLPVSSIEWQPRDALTECSSIGAAFAASASVLMERLPEEQSPETGIFREEEEDTVNASVPDAASEATDKLARALEAIKPSTRSSSIMAPSNTATSTPPQNDNITPLHSDVKPSVLETPLDDSAPPSLTATPDISPTTKGTILDVEVADYTKHFTAAQAMSSVCDDNVLWEKVTLATQTDDDYVPMADYSHVKPKFSLSAFATHKTKKKKKNMYESPYAQHQLLLRKHRNARRRRQRRLALAGVLMLLCCGVSYYYLLQGEVLSKNFTDMSGRLRDATEGDGEQINEEIVLTAQNETVECGDPGEQAVEVATTNDIHGLPFCEMPFSSRWSPICDSRHHKHDNGRLGRLIMTEELLAVMMQ